MQNRLNRFMTKLTETDLDAMLVTGERNVFYWTGFWGTAGTVFISQQRRIFVTDSRYILTAKQIIKDFEVEDKTSPQAHQRKSLRSRKYIRVSI